jgi:hydroxylamine oxidation protein HaoB
LTSRLYKIIGSLLIVAGTGVLIFGLPVWDEPRFQLEKELEIRSSDPGFPAIPSTIPVESLTVYRARLPGVETALPASVAAFRDTQGQAGTALLSFQEPPPKAGKSSADKPSWGESDRRYRIWMEAAESIRQHAEPNALVVAWWDNSQRVRLLTGLETWTLRPAAEGFSDPEERDFWRVLGGGFAEDPAPGKTLARWLTGDADDAIAALRAELPAKSPVYFLVTADDLGRLQEMARLGGRSLSIQSNRFPLTGDIHGAVNSVKRWVAEIKAPGYLVRQEGPSALRAWASPDGQGKDTLLFRLLPFSDSLSRPLPEFRLVYQSGWGGYLSLYRWAPESKPRAKD